MEQRKILLIEDDFSLQKVLSYNLKKHDFHVEIANNGKEAIEFLKHYKVDLILTDIVMPELNGIDMFLQLKETDILEHTKIVFISGYEAELNKKVIADWPKIKRPYKWSELLDLIKNVLNL